MQCKCLQAFLLEKLGIVRRGVFGLFSGVLAAGKG